MMIDLTDRVAVVTGGAQGIGRGICLVLAQQGASVAVADVNPETAESVASEVSDMGRKALAIGADVTDRTSVSDMAAQVLEGFGRIDILVNNAGVVGAPDFWDREDINDDDWDSVLAVNLRGVVNVSEAVAPHMMERCYGKIVNIASIAARLGGPSLPHYSASKAGVVSWTQSHALHLAPYDINVNAICPGLLWTPLFERLIKRGGYEIGSSADALTGREHFDRIVESRMPLKRGQTPEDTGKMAAFLVSDDARNITGQAINVDGGRRMN